MVPGNDASKAETRVDGGWGGSIVRESWRLQLETRIEGIAMVRRSPEKSLFLDFS